MKPLDTTVKVLLEAIASEIASRAYFIKGPPTARTRAPASFDLAGARCHRVPSGPLPEALQMAFPPGAIGGDPRRPHERDTARALRSLEHGESKTSASSPSGR
jgi:hypothetical protein